MEDVFVLGDEEDLEDVLRRIYDAGRFECVLLDNTRMDEPAQVSSMSDVSYMSVVCQLYVREERCWN